MTVELLLDTHAFVWWVTDVGLGESATEAIERADEVSVSAVALWEIVLKESTRHPMVGTDDAHRWFADAMAATGFGLVDITVADIGAVQRLPLVHRDPFDRLLIAQARARALTIVTRDATIPGYDVEVLAVA